jgi:hypothetical protein
MARAHAASFGAPVYREPHEAIEWAMALTAAEIEFYDRQIQQLEEREIAGQVSVQHRRPLKEEKGAEDPSVEVVETRELGPAAHIWVQLRAQAIDRYAKYAKAAADMDVDERRTRIAERTSNALAGVVNAVMADLVEHGLSAELRALAGERFRHHVALLDVVEGSAVEVAS